MREMNPRNFWQRSFRAASSAVMLLLLFSFASGAAVDSPPAGNVKWKRIDAGQATKANKVPRFAEQELLVKFRKTASEEKKTKIHNKFGAQKLREYKSVRLQRVKFRKGISIEEAIAEYQADPDVEYAEPNYTVSPTYTYPNDAQSSNQWGLSKLKATSAWDLTTGSHDIVVAVIDSGIDYTHPDLAANMWVNPGEIAGNGIDDDGNGYIDDLHGINAITGSGNPMDDDSHGTHVAGIIGAVGNNAIGVAGVNWNVDMIGCKFISSSGYGYVSDAIECLEYLKDLKSRPQNPVNIIVSNNSWGGGGFSQALYDAIAVQPDILFVTAAGNDGSSNDAFEFYPANYPLPNILSVAATENNDSLASYSNFGKRNVDVAAPGSSIVSTWPGNSYVYASGTSMASPHAAGTAALLAAYGKTWKQARNLLLTGGDQVAGLAETTLTGQRINAYGSLTCSNRTLLSPLDLPDSITAGVPAAISVMSINCDIPWGPVSVTVNGTETLQLLDDGVSPDLFADDGVFSGSWTPSSSATLSLEFNSPAGSFPVTVPALRISETAVVDPPATMINASAVSTATNVPFRQDFNATGGLAPLTWGLEGGSLPTGLVLDSYSGEVTGTPTSPGVYTYDVEVTDADSTTDVMLDQLLLVNDYIRPDQPIILPGCDDNQWLKTSPVFADLDGDGKDEIIVSTVSALDTKSSLYVYDENGLVARRDFSGYVSTPAVADFDRDGQSEIVVSVGWWLTPAPPIYALKKDLTTLPGFPTYGGINTMTGHCGFQESPVISDLNNDGNLSIITICSPNYLYDPYYTKEIISMIDAQGKTLAGWPKAVGVYDDRLDNLVSVGDLDGNGSKEIVFFSANGVLHVFDKQGAELAQWTVFSGSGFPSRPVLADFTGDGELEIAINYIQSQSQVVIYDRFGNLLPGWPRSYYSAADSGLMAADMNRDGRKELVFTSTKPGSFDPVSFSRYLQVLNYDGTPLAGWPVYTASYTQGFSRAAIGDINGDGEQEIVVIDIYNSLLDGFGQYGVRLTGYPKYFVPGGYANFRAAYPALGDFDGNDRVDIAVKSDGNTLYIWESPQTYASLSLEWPMFGRDPQHSNNNISIVLPVVAQARLLFSDPMTFSSIGGAYDSIWGDDTIQVTSSTFVEDLVFDKDLTVFLQGGFNDDFSVNSGISTIQGSLTVSNGALKIERIRVR